MVLEGLRVRVGRVVRGGAVLALLLPVDVALAAPTRARVKPKPAALASPVKASPGLGEVKVGASEAPPEVQVVETEEGVKTYTFGAQELEGRLRSPQILYFLRRVRAEFDPQPLGHRSFLLELRDTRRHPAL